MVHEGEQSGLWKFKDVTYTGKLPEVRPLVLEEALKKWPDARLNCSADDLCVPTKDDE